MGFLGWSSILRGSFGHVGFGFVMGLVFDVFMGLSLLGNLVGCSVGVVLSFTGSSSSSELVNWRSSCKVS